MKVLRNDVDKFKIAIESFKPSFVCIACKANLSSEPYKDSWESDKKYAWLYIECPKCHYQNALWKILSTNRANRKRKGE